MALKWIEGFDSFGTSDGSDVVGLDFKYPGSTIPASVKVRNGKFSGSYSLRNENGSTALTLISPSLGSMGTVIIGFAFKCGTLASDRLISFREDDDATDGVNLRLTSGGALAVYTGGTLRNTSATTPISTGVWYYIEAKFVIGNSNAYEVRVDGANVLSGTADLQSGSTAAVFRFRINGRAGANVNWQYDDLYLCDGSGGVNDDFLGEQKVVTIFPDAAGDDADWTPSSGSNYQAVDESASGPDSDTSYVESAVTDDQDLYGFPTPSGVGTIIGVQHNTVVKKTDVTNYDIKPVCKSGATESVDPATTVSSTSYRNVARVLEEDPDTSAAWTDSGVGAAQFGYRVG